MGVLGKIINPAEMCALVVDDNRTDRELTSGVLRYIGFKVVDVAFGGQEGLDKCKNNKYDIVFMDLLMPEVDGYDATMRVRQLGQGSFNARIVALTSSIFDEKQVLKCVANGMSDCIRKPLKVDLLKKRMLRWK